MDQPDEVHDFVFPFSRNIGVRKDHLHVLPAGIIVQPILVMIIQLKVMVMMETDLDIILQAL